MRQRFLILLFLGVITLSVYRQTGSFEFINFDDQLYVANNLHVHAGITMDTIKWAFSTFEATNWHPLTWLSHAIDCQLYGLAPGGHHLTNIFLHLANTLLLFLLLNRLTGALWRSAFVAAMFAIHPLHVESVAWVSERKDVLSTLLLILTLLAYSWYVEQQQRSRYLLTILLFVLGLMAKPMLVTLPFILILLDFWPLGRFNSGFALQNRITQTIIALIREKLPFFTASAISSLITFYAQQKGGAVGSLEVYPLSFRIENAIISYANYIVKMFWPTKLAFFYPYTFPLPLWQVAGAVLLLVFISATVAVKSKRFPYLMTGWLWYLGTLIPVIGLVQIGLQSMADRYTYVPLIGLFIIVSWGVTDILNNWRYQGITAAILSVTVISLLTFQTWQQIGNWKSTYALYSHAVSVTENNYMAHNIMGNTFIEKKQFREAVHYYSLSLTFDPNQHQVHYFLGLALTELGELGEAEKHYAEAIRIKPDFAGLYYKLGLLYGQQGKTSQAIYCLNQALLLDPLDANAHYNLGIIYARLEQYDQAKHHFNETLRIMPDNVGARSNLEACIRLNAHEEQVKTKLQSE